MLPITSNAANRPAGSHPANDAGPAEKRSADAAAQFEGLLFASALAPLSKEIGMLGDVLTDAVATSVARATHDDFYGRLQAAIDAGPEH